MEIILKRRYFFASLSGIFFSIPFFYPEFYIVSFFSAVPFLLILFDGLKDNKTIKYTIVFGMSFYMPVYVWFLWMYPMEQTGLTPFQSFFTVIAAWIGFPVIQTFALLILPVGLKIFKRAVFFGNIFILPLLAAFLYVITEWVQSWFLSGLTWAKLSVSQYKNLFFIQSVSLFGTYFSGFIIIFINAALAAFILSKTKKSALIIASLFLYFINSYFGYFRIMYKDYAQKANGEKTISAQIIQGNISSYEKWEESGVEYSLAVYGELMGENGESPEICVLPETAIPGWVKNGGVLYERLRDLAVKNNTTLFAGAIFNDWENDKRYNAIIAFNKNYDFIRPYGKCHLVPFGEYLPFEGVLVKIFPFVSNIALFDSVLTPGKDPAVMDINGVKYGGLVCFDSIFPELARKSVLDGAEILIISTNDSWFRDSPAIYQHNAQAVLRAVENNRYVIRAANTGLSSFISPTGEILQKSNVLQREILTCGIRAVKSKTVYTVCGDIILYTAFAYIAFCTVLTAKTSRRA